MILNIAAKGSRKTKSEFFRDIEYLANIVKSIEIDFNYPHDKDFGAELKFLKQLKAKKGLSYSVHAQHLSGNLNDVNDKIRRESLKQIFQAIDWADYLEAKLVTIHPALEPYGLKISGQPELEIEIYKKIARYAKKKKINIGLENEAQTCFWFPDRACRIDNLIETVAAVNEENFGHTLDIGHANISGEDYLRALEKIGNKLFHIHVHDNFGGPETNLTKCHRVDPHLPLGRGIIDWCRVIQTLKKINYQNYLEIESEIPDIEQSLKYLKELEKEPL
ncbi:MAG: sugar phosphate isomerase/epimerase family protein [Patescibacteria group bacterium]|jgi:sugar phosphate isomerase/epimerase